MRRTEDIIAEIYKTMTSVMAPACGKAVKDVGGKKAIFELPVAVSGLVFATAVANLLAICEPEQRQQKLQKLLEALHAQIFSQLPGAEARLDELLAASREVH